MNQISFSEDIRKTKPKLKKTQGGAKVTFSQPAPKKENYMTLHNKFKVYYRNREYKNVYEKLLKLEKPEQTYMILYLEDLVSSVNKMLREYIVHKEVNSSSNVQACILQGKDTLFKLYKLFTFNEEITNQRKSVCLELQNSITRFLNIIISFTLKSAVICMIQNKTCQAKSIYEALYCICSSVLTSTTSNYKILRKVGQGLIVYSVYLIDTQQITSAIKVLFDCLKNEMNLLIILSYRVKQKSRTESKRRKLQLFNRLYAIFFNLTHCFHLTHQLHWCFLCLKECQIIAELKVKLLEKDIKINWQEVLKTYKIIYDQYIELTKISEVYFNVKELKNELDMCKKYEANPINYHEEVHKEMNSFNSFSKSNKVELQKKKKRVLRRSVSLQQTLEAENNKRIYKEYGQEFLFYGFNLFEKPTVIKSKIVHTSIFNDKSNMTITQYQQSKHFLRDHEHSHKISQNNPSKLKKKYKKVENTLFRKIKKPIEYDQLQNKFQKMWADQERMNNKCKEKRYLLRYKSQYINYKQIAEENTNIYQEIQVIKSKNQFTFKERKKSHQVQEEEKQKGLELFKKIALKHAKQLDIKKSQTFNILKKKRVSRCQFDSCTPPDASVNFLLQKVKKEKQRAEDGKNKIKEEQIEKIERLRHKGIGCENVFLTKDTVQIPNLFLSYITSTGVPPDEPQSLLEQSNQQQIKPA